MLEIYSLRMQLKDTEKELRFYEEENDTILRQINEILISEENNISLLLKEIYNEADSFSQIENFFSEFDVKFIFYCFFFLSFYKFTQYLQQY